MLNVVQLQRNKRKYKKKNKVKLFFWFFHHFENTPKDN